jgi:hypothetical protein
VCGVNVHVSDGRCVCIPPPPNKLLPDQAKCCRENSMLQPGDPPRCVCMPGFTWSETKSAQVNCIADTL